MAAVRTEAEITAEIDAIRQAASDAGRRLTPAERERIDDLIVERAAVERAWLADARAAYVREQRAYWRPKQRARPWTTLSLSPIFLALLAASGVSGVLLASSPPERMVRPLTFVFIFSAWVATVCIHEFGHALAGYLGGDRSVAERGYLTLDPRVYTNPLLSIVLPILFLLMGGIALPGGSVLIDDHALRSRRWRLYVSAAGPLGTLVCLVLAGLPFLVVPDAWITDGNIYFFAALAGLVKLLAIVLILNLLPIPPLDGFRILAHWLPDEMAARAYALGWMPLMLLYLTLARPSPLTDAFWSAGDRLAGIFQLPQGWGEYAISLLSLV
jgi:Zn-dependent protease